MNIVAHAIYGLQLSIYFNFCCFRALAYTTLDKLSAVFFYF